MSNKSHQVPYHSFWVQPEPYVPLHTVKYGENIGFVMDISSTHKYPENAPKPDVIYTDAPYPIGYKVFADREKPYGDYDSFVLGLKSIIDSLSVPTFVITAVRTLKKMEAHNIYRAKIVLPVEKFDGWIGVWNTDEKVYSREDILSVINENYNLVYDPCCGYLSIAKDLPNCKFIFSDINPTCIGGSLAALEKRGY